LTLLTQAAEQLLQNHEPGSTSSSGWTCAAATVASIGGSSGGSIFIDWRATSASSPAAQHQQLVGPRDEARAVRCLPPSPGAARREFAILYGAAMGRGADCRFIETSTGRRQLDDEDLLPTCVKVSVQAHAQHEYGSGDSAHVIVPGGGD
jgi:hypothetical protein